MIQDRAGIWHAQPYALPARGNLMPFQAQGAAWMTPRAASLLGDDMGLGKTCQAIEVINSLPLDARVLIIAPAGLRINWLRELAVWLTMPRRCAIVKKYVPTWASVVIVNYDLLEKFQMQLRAISWDLIVCDEAHTIRNPWTVKCRQVLGDTWTPMLQAPRKILLTGTPLLNRPIEVWPLLRWLGLEMTREEFGNAFCGGGDFMGCENREGLSRLLSRFMLRRTKAEVLTELPAKTRQIVRIAASGRARIAMAAELAFERQAQGIGRFRGGVPMTEMSELRLTTGLAKLEMPEIQSIIQEACESSGKVVIFVYHNECADRVAAMLAGRCVKYTGRNTAEERQKAVDMFQTNPRCQAFIGTIGAAGVGITLTAASHALFLEEDWTPGLIDQAEDRIWRHGQKNACLVQHLVLDGSIDARQLEIQVEKAGNISEILKPKAA